jgi:hypothetical protein
VRHRVREGRGTDERGAGWRRQGRSPVAGRREAEQKEVLDSGGGVGWRMQWREVGWTVGGGGQSARGRASSARSDGGVHGDVGVWAHLARL